MTITNIFIMLIWNAYRDEDAQKVCGRDVNGPDRSIQDLYER